MTEKKPLNHPDYEFAPGCFNLSQWSRENEPKGEPLFKPGQRVRLNVDLYVAAIGKDCDGSHLYALSYDEYAHGESDPRQYACMHSVGQDALVAAPSPTEPPA